MGLFVAVVPEIIFYGHIEYSTFYTQNFKVKKMEEEISLNIAFY
jgi:hypothetical protein